MVNVRDVFYEMAYVEEKVRSRVGSKWIVWRRSKGRRRTGGKGTGQQSRDRFL
jgi:hypothetical protein